MPTGSPKATAATWQVERQQGAGAAGGEVLRLGAPRGGGGGGVRRRPSEASINTSSWEASA